MLFDLRGRGRRRTVRIIYLGLALLMGGGLVFFGVGGSVGGGLLDAVNSNGGSGGGGDQLAKAAKQLQVRARRNPANKHLWAELAQTQFEDATSGANFDSTTGVITAAGQAKLKAAAVAWERYLSLNPAKPDASIAAVMAQAYSALGRFAKAATAAEIVTGAQPNSGRTRNWRSTRGRRARHARATSPRRRRSRWRRRTSATRSRATSTSSRAAWPSSRRRAPRAPRRSDDRRYPAPPRPYSSTGRAADS